MQKAHGGLLPPSNGNADVRLGANSRPIEQEINAVFESGAGMNLRTAQAKAFAHLC
jgi:hypothetical protein